MTVPGIGRAAKRALEDPVLGRNVVRATDLSTIHRKAAVAERPDWEALRQRAEAVRAHALGSLDRHLAGFVEEARRRGAVVHSAADADEACRIVLDLVEGAEGTRILKSKSMTSEEVGLNARLEARGLEPLETDLGEYIVQLAGEPPSHITAPALHRSTEQIHDLFRKHGVLEGAGAPPEDRVELAAWLSLRAREHLRQRLLDADVGITGANFLVAETGTIVLVENEGNIRFTTTSPRIQIALAGIDKVVPRLEDLATLLPLLTRSATGQRATSYVQMISGPVGEALHVVLLDGGRSRLLADPDDREILHCIRCGACMNVCPVYRTVGGHAYGSPYPGPIGALLTPLLRDGPGDDELPFASTLCGACTEACPARIDLDAHLLRHRGRFVGEGRRGAVEAGAFGLWRFLMAGPRRYAFAGRLARILQVPAKWLGLLHAWTRTRAEPRVARRSFLRSWRRR
ncbi:MAG: lactate utilization protein B [Planctomycetota bacterium]